MNNKATLNMLNAQPLTVGLSAPTSTAPFTLQRRVSRQVWVGVVRWCQAGVGGCSEVVPGRCVGV